MSAKDRIRGKASQALYAEIIIRTRQGHSALEIAAALGVSHHCVNHRRRILQQRGVLVGGHYERSARRNPNSALNYMKNRHGILIGTMRDFAAALTREQLAWLAKETPKGAKLVETLAAIVRDIYAEECGE